MTPWRDVSMALHAGMTAWPGDPLFRRDLVESLERGDVATVSALHLSSHTGTHVDAPAHFVAGAASIDLAPLDVLIGPVRVVQVSNPDVVDVEALRAIAPRPGERLLLRTANSDRRFLQGPFTMDYVAPTAQAARFLVECGVVLVGVDSLSVGRPDDGLETHRILLGAGIWVVEGLDLADVAPGSYDMICLPLRIPGGDGAPARVLLR
jgi:arylformamidase